MKSFDTLISQATRAAAAKDRQIKQMISQIVPAKTATQVQFCRVEGGRLRITVSAAVWISRLRFSERQIIDSLRTQGFDCHTASYHVSPEEAPTARKTIRHAKRSESGVQSMVAAADSVSESADDRLRQELLKLARSLGKRI